MDEKSAEITRMRQRHFDCKKNSTLTIGSMEASIMRMRTGIRNAYIVSGTILCGICIAVLLGVFVYRSGKTPLCAQGNSGTICKNCKTARDAVIEQREVEDVANEDKAETRGMMRSVDYFTSI